CSNQRMRAPPDRSPPQRLRVIVPSTVFASPSARSSMLRSNAHSPSSVRGSGGGPACAELRRLTETMVVGAAVAPAAPGVIVGTRSTRAAKRWHHWCSTAHTAQSVQSAQPGGPRMADATPVTDTEQETVHVADGVD